MNFLDKMNGKRIIKQYVKEIKETEISSRPLLIYGEGLEFADFEYLAFFLRKRLERKFLIRVEKISVAGTNVENVFAFVVEYSKIEYYLTSESEQILL